MGWEGSPRKLLLINIILLAFSKCFLIFLTFNIVSLLATFTCGPPVPFLSLLPIFFSCLSPILLHLFHSLAPPTLPTTSPPSPSPGQGAVTGGGSWAAGLSARLPPALPRPVPALCSPHARLHGRPPRLKGRPREPGITVPGEGRGGPGKGLEGWSQGMGTTGGKREKYGAPIVRIMPLAFWVKDSK